MRQGNILLVLKRLPPEVTERILFPVAAVAVGRSKGGPSSPGGLPGGALAGQPLILDTRIRWRRIDRQHRKKRLLS